MSLYCSIALAKQVSESTSKQRSKEFPENIFVVKPLKNPTFCIKLLKFVPIHQNLDLFCTKKQNNPDFLHLLQ